MISLRTIILRRKSAHEVDGSAKETRHGVLKEYTFVVIVLILAALALVSLSSREHGRRVTREEFGAAWPFTVSSAMLMCENGHEITVTVRGTTYSLTPNPQANREAYDNVGPIWANNPSSAGRMPMAPLVEAGQKLCH